MTLHVSAISGRRFADFLLFSVTSIELAILFLLTPTLTITDCIYVLQHIVVLGVALTRPAPRLQDRSLQSAIAVVVAYAYAYAEVIYLSWIPGERVWPELGFVLVTLAAGLSLVSLLTLGRFFGVRPALRGLVTTGPYGLIRHPIYLAYMIGDIGYNLQEWNLGTVLLTMAGWTSLLYRIHAEEKLLSRDPGWPTYAAIVRNRLLPGIW